MSRKIKWMVGFLLFISKLAAADSLPADSLPADSLPADSPPADSPVENSAIQLHSINGETLYRKLCAQCHGSEGIPPTDIVDLLRPAPPDLSAPEDDSKRSLSYIEERIRSGSSKNMMHYNGWLDAEQARALAEFVQSLQKNRR